jgi:predicted nucleic acid-binding protein
MAKLPKPAANIPNPSRTHSRVERRYLTAERRAQMWPEVQAARDSKAIEIAHPDRDSHLQPTARRRIPRDPNDWPTVHLAIALDASILTNDDDCLGCGNPTWTVETLRAELANT